MGRALLLWWEETGGEQDVSPPKRPIFPLPVPGATLGGSQTPSATGQGGCRARGHGSSGEAPVVFLQESSHIPHRSAPFLAGADISPSRIPAASPPRQQLAPSLCAGNASPKRLLPCQRRLRQKNPSQPRMQAAQSTPLHNSAVPKGTSGSIASPRRAASSRLSASAPNTCLGPLPSSTPALGHRAARGVTDPSRAMAKGPRPRGDTAGHVPSPGEHLSGDVPKRRAQEEGARGHVSPGPVATP